MRAVAEFVAQERSWQVLASAANTNRDGTTGTYVTVAAAAAGGKGIVIERVTYQSRVTTTAGLLRLFIADGTNVYLFEEIVIAAATVSGTVPGASGVSAKITADNPLRLQAGWSLTANINNAEATTIVASGGEK